MSPTRAAPGTDARAATYRLLGRLHLEEVDRATAEYLRGVPGLSERIPPEAGLDAWLRDLRVEHQWLFGINVYPYESVFVGSEVMLRNEATRRVEAFYRRAGFRPARDLRCGAPDHVGVELILAAELVEGGRTGELGRWVHGHLAAWGPVFAWTTARVAGDPFYGALGELTAEFLLSEAAETGSPEVGEPPEDEEEPAGGGAPEEEDGTGGPGLQQVVDRLLTPSRSGIFLARRDILELGRSVDLPVGVLERALMLKTLFRSAGQFERVRELLEGLRRFLEEADARYREWTERHPAWAPHGRRWRARTGEGIALLEAMEEAEGSGAEG